MNARPITMRVVIVAIVSGIVAGALTSLVYVLWGPSIPSLLGGGRAAGSPNVVPMIVTTAVTLSILSDRTLELRRRRKA